MDRSELIERLKQGESVKYLFFWGHRPSADGSVSKSCLSQWWPADFSVDGEMFATAEHWMMAAKASLFGDAATRSKILLARTPGEAKALGRKVRDYDEARWEAERFAIVVSGNLHKFSQHPPLGAWLCATGQRILVEASPQDRIWGIGLDEHHPDAARPEQWPGLNLLGFALMEVRTKLKS
ncbi:MAG: NADAR family protein [Candidatus Sericytochromatia bacterium]